MISCYNELCRVQFDSHLSSVTCNKCKKKQYHSEICKYSDHKHIKICLKYNGGSKLPKYLLSCNLNINPSIYTSLKKISIHEKYLGQGAYSQVVQGLYENKKVAIKKLKKSMIINQNIQNNFLVEIGIHSALHHPHITQLIGIAEDQFFIYLILELGELGTLKGIFNFNFRIHKWKKNN